MRRLNTTINSHPARYQTVAIYCGGLHIGNTMTRRADPRPEEIDTLPPLFKNYIRGLEDENGKLDRKVKSLEQSNCELLIRDSKLKERLEIAIAEKNEAKELAKAEMKDEKESSPASRAQHPAEG